MRKETFVRLVKSLEQNKTRKPCANRSEFEDAIIDCIEFEDAIIDCIELEFGPAVRDYVVYHLYEKELFPSDTYRNVESVEELYEIIIKQKL